MDREGDSAVLSGVRSTRLWLSSNRSTVTRWRSSLTRNGVPFEREVWMEVWSEGIRMGRFRADFVVAKRVIVEVKATEYVTEADHKQTLNYLRSSTNEVGLMLHFGPEPEVHRLIFTNDCKTAVP